MVMKLKLAPSHWTTRVSVPAFTLAYAYSGRLQSQIRSSMNCRSLGSFPVRNPCVLEGKRDAIPLSIHCIQCVLIDF